MPHKTDESGIKKNVISGLFWKAMENGGDQAVTFVISVILARLLGPEKYGTMATMLIFITIANVVIQNGFQTALIQKRDLLPEDLSSVLWTGIGIALVIYIIIFACSPLIADFFGDSDIEAMLRVLSLVLFIGAVTSVEIAIAAREMNFRIQCGSTIAADIVSGAIGIATALKGLGTWALVLQQLTKQCVLMLLLFLRLGWRPVFIVSFKRLAVLLDYGWKVLASGLIDTLYTNIYTPIISRLYNAQMVGYYSRGNQFPQIIVNAMASTVQAVMLPAFSRIQDEREREVQILRRAVKLSGFIMFPALFGLAATADSLVLLLLGKEWLPAAALLRLCCLSYSVWHIHVVNLQLINANGRSDIYLKLEIIKKAIGVLVLALSIRLGITGMLLMKALFDYVCTFINAWPNRKLVGYGPFGQWRDALPEFVLAAMMCAVVWLLQFIITGGAGVSELSFGALAGLLILQVAAGIIIYIGAAWALGMESMRYLKETMKLIIGGRL